MKKELINYEIPQNSDDNIVHNWEPLKRTIDSNFKYEHKNLFYRLFSRFLWILAMIVLTPLNYVLFGVKVKNKKNLKLIKGGSVIVSNRYDCDDKLELRIGTCEGSGTYTDWKSNDFIGTFEEFKQLLQLHQDIKSGRVSVVRHRIKKQ